LEGNPVQASRVKKLVIVLVVGALSAALFAVGTANADQQDAPHAKAINASKGNSHTTVSYLVDHGGPVLPSAKLFAIWWGPASGFPSDAQSGMTTFLQGFGASSYVQIAAQYMRGASLNVTYGGAYHDTSTPPAKLSPNQVAAEIQTVLNGATPDANGIYVLFTSTFPHGNFCAWHTGATVSGVSIAEAYVPNATADLAGCGVPSPTAQFTPGTQGIADSAAHEIMEAITDPHPTGTGLAWIDNGGQEIADKCETQYGTLPHIGGVAWNIQEEWSNAALGCAQGS
jgi:hypothetical protein